MKKALSLILVLMMVTLILGACGNSAVPPTTSQGTPAPVSGPKTQMVFSTLTGGASELHASLIMEQIQAFNENNPYNVEFVLEAYENEQYKTKQATLMASNAQPDVFFTWEAGYMKPFVEGDKIYPIGDKLLADAEWSGRFPDQGVFGPVTFDGKIYGVPHSRSIAVVAYNKKLFNDVGATVPTTYDEFLKVCDAFVSKGVTPLIVPCQQAWLGGQMLQQLSNAIGGKDLFDAISAGTTTWDDPRFIEAATELKNLADKKYLPNNYLGMSPNEAYEMLDTDGAGMFLIITSGITSLKNLAEDDNLGLFLLPPKAPSNAGVNVGSIGLTFAVSANSKNIDAACDMVKLLSGTDFQEKLIYEAGQIITTNTPLDNSKLSKVTVDLLPIFEQVTTYTPWLDRIYGAGEGVEFNNAAVAILAGGDPTEQMKNLQQFAIDNATR